MTEEVWDPPGSPEAQAAYRKMKAEIDAKLGKGRKAILDDAEEWVPDPDRPPQPPSDDAPDDAPDDSSPPKEEGLLYDHVRIPRIFGKEVRMVRVTLPHPCPITPLGKMGRQYFYLSPLGELIALADAEHGQAHIAGLWSPKIDDLNRAFPQFNAQGKFQGFRANLARDAMMAGCAAKGIFEAHQKVRGRGCWKGDDGQLIQHLGDKILFGEEEFTPGEIAGHVYPGRPAMPAPKGGGLPDVEQIYTRLRLWNYARGELDARLLLGQLAVIVLGAAIDWRSMTFLTGGAGTGKSSLQRFMRELLPGRLLGSGDASEASLRGLLGQDAVGVSFDEIEADALNDKAQAVMKLARLAASGEDAFRSTSSQDVRQFTLRGSFIFSAIIPPSMRAQDAQRFAMIIMRNLPEGASLAEVSPALARDWGCGLVGRVAAGWPRWQETLQRFVAGLARAGHAQRGAMQFGTLLAGAHVLLRDTLPDDVDVDFWCRQLHRQTLMEYANDAPAWLQAWQRLLSAQPEVWRSDGFPTVAEIVRKYLALAEHGEKTGTELEEAQAKIRLQLERAGLAIVRSRKTNHIFLAIPPSHQAIADIYAGTDFQKRGGEGAWTIPLRAAPPFDGESGVMTTQVVTRLNSQKCTLFWLDGLVNVGGVTTRIFERLVVEDLMDEVDREPGEEG